MQNCALHAEQIYGRAKTGSNGPVPTCLLWSYTNKMNPHSQKYSLIMLLHHESCQLIIVLLPM